MYKRQVLSLVLSTILVLVIVAATGALNQASGDDIAAATSTLAAIFQTAWLPATLIVQSASGDALSFLLFLALSAAVAGIFIVFAARFYRRMNNVHPRRRATTFSLGDLKVRSPFRAMCRRELSRYFSCTIYALNSSIGMVLLLAFSVLLAFGGANAITAYAGEVDVGSMLRAARPLILAMFVSITCTTSASLSLEGRSRWIMCSLPVRSIDCLLYTSFAPSFEQAKHHTMQASAMTTSTGTTSKKRLRGGRALGERCDCCRWLRLPF